MPEPNRRRSERILLTLPIRVEGLDAKGQKFVENTRTLVINRHGARIQLKHSVTPGVNLRVTNLVGNREGQFRVVGLTQPISEEGGEWGVESMDERHSIWGIDFPPAQNGESACSALLECRRCHGVALTHMSVVEIDVLTNAGLLTKDCKACGQATAWGYTETQVGMPVPGQEPEPSIREVMEPPPAAANRRVNARVALRLPIRVRKWEGTVEFAKSENVSKGGLGFVSDKDYEIGEAVQVTCPYDPKGHNIEIRARVVRCREMKGTGRKVYGLRYEK